LVERRWGEVTWVSVVFIFAGKGTAMPDTPNRGFAAMDPEQQRLIAAKGGRAAHERGTAHQFSRDEARAAGQKGGQRVSVNREHMSEIGRRGGQRVSVNREHMSDIGRRGGQRVSADRRHMSQIGREGGHVRAAAPAAMPAPL
jgi:general stress protein YciG